MMGYFKKPLRILFISEMTHVTLEGPCCNNNDHDDDHDHDATASSFLRLVLVGHTFARPDRKCSDSDLFTGCRAQPSRTGGNTV